MRTRILPLVVFTVAIGIACFMIPQFSKGQTTSGFVRVDNVEISYLAAYEDSLTIKVISYSQDSLWWPNFWVGLELPVMTETNEIIPEITLGYSSAARGSMLGHKLSSCVDVIPMSLGDSLTFSFPVDTHLTTPYWMSFDFTRKSETINDDGCVPRRLYSETASFFQVRSASW